MAAIPVIPTLVLVAADSASRVTAPGTFHTIGAMVLTVVGPVLGTKDETEWCLFKIQPFTIDEFLRPGIVFFPFLQSFQRLFLPLDNHMTTQAVSRSEGF